MTDSTKVGEASSGEVVNGFRSCRDLSDIVPFYTPRGIYLKPIAKVHVSINLPQLKTPGKTISTWEVMEKVRLLIRPDEFASLKVVKSTLEFIRLEGDLGDKSRLQRVLARLDAQRLNLAGFPNVLKVKAAEVKDDFPTRHSWDSYFRDAKHMNELKAGERPDTIHVSGLPIKWFSEDGETPNEALVAKIFKKWGTLRRIDVPAADPYRSRMRLGTSIQKFSYEDGIFFDVFVQYVEYMDFVKAMDALRGMKLLKKEKEMNHLVASLKVDFDKTKHMSDSSVSRRDFERKRLIAQDNLAAEKLRRKEQSELKKKEEMKKKEELDLKARESRRRSREDKRKRKAITVFRKQEEDKVSLKIAREERKLIKAQRQLESIRLLDALFDRIKIKLENNEITIKPKTANDKTEKSDDKVEKKSKENENNIKKKDKKDKVKKKKSKKDKKKKKKTANNATDDSESDKKKGKSDSQDTSNPYADLPTQPWYYNSAMAPILHLYRGFARGRRGGLDRGQMNYPPLPYPEIPGQPWYYNSSLLHPIYRGFSRGRRGGFDRGKSKNGPWMFNSSAASYRENDSDKSRSRSRSRSRHRTSRSRSRKKRSRSRSRSRRRTSNSKKRTASRSRSRSSSRDRSTKSRSKSRSHSSSRCSRSRTRKRRRRSESRVRITRAKSRSGSPKCRSRSSSWSLPKSRERRSCSWSKNVDEIDKTSPKKTEETEAQAYTPKEKRNNDTVVEATKP